MYENYSKQSLPSKEYRELLGSAICVFNSNNAFIIENILRIDSTNYNWFNLIDKTSGGLLKPIEDTITNTSDEKISQLFADLVAKRNRIIHSFQVTKNNEQVLATKTKDHEQFIITEQYLLDFINENETLAVLLDSFRASNTPQI